jgi:hypothetical protein
MSTKSALKAGFKGLLALNGATVVRALRYGPASAKRSLEETYRTVDPFSTFENQPAHKLLKRVPEKQLNEIVPWPAEMVLDLRFTDISGSTPICDIAAILALAIAQQPLAVLEFGTFWGSATFNLARNLPNASIHTIDLPADTKTAEKLIADQPIDDLHLIQSRSLGQAFRDTPQANRITQHSGDTATYDYSVISDPVSFFLIDGSHTYEYAKSDTLRAFALGHGMSTFTWHDCDMTHTGVTTWLGELIDAGLPVQRIAGTVVACLRIDATDQRLRRFLK